jgi:septal ring factor EnvC (AmiA/AmiB activator)
MPEIIAKNPQTLDTKPEISLIDEVSSPEVQPVSDLMSTEPVIEMPPISLSKDNNPATLEDRIAGFVADLERLKADDEMVLHEKESAIEKLETEMKELTKEIKKIQADEKRIDATIASINTPVTKTK